MNHNDNHNDLMLFTIIVIMIINNDDHIDIITIMNKFDYGNNYDYHKLINSLSL